MHINGVELVGLVSLLACGLFALVALIDQGWQRVQRVQRAAERYDAAEAEYALATARWLSNRGACERDARGRFIRHACNGGR